jgi:alkanesulfonate monooxygenase SsuD/methylene tetrahydromethanopterin reductase-like flavin-dependent oxidoreductase (luciferase family)
LHVHWLPNHWDSYAKWAAEGGHEVDRSIWRVARSIFVADDDKTARAYGGDDEKSPYRFYLRQLLAKLGRGKKLGSLKNSADMKDEDVTVDYAVENLVIRGTPEAVTDRILEMHEAIGDFGTLLYCGKDWTNVKLGRRSMELMAEKVMPAVNAALGRRVAAE